MKAFKHSVSDEHKGKSEIIYFDSDMNPVSRDKATWAVVRNLDEKGNLLFEAEGFID
jgi:hypothetical protein